MVVTEVGVDTVVEVAQAAAEVVATAEAVATAVAAEINGTTHSPA